ncbi:MAG: hypothetical protein ACK5L7_05805 [Paludibacteraceae bacterium]
MRKIYYVTKINQAFSVDKKEDIVTFMRECEWNSKSDNSDYMHVYAFWKFRQENAKIRFAKESEFIDDLISLGYIFEISKWNYYKRRFTGNRQQIKTADRIGYRTLENKPSALRRYFKYIAAIF